MTAHHTHHRLQTGFTLIEVMLVIVIMAVMASLIVMNLQGVDQRKVMQARELLLLDLQKVRLESMDQGRVLGLIVLPATDIAKAQYKIIEYSKVESPQEQQTLLQQTSAPQERYQWQPAQDFKTKDLPDQSSMIIQTLDHQLDLDRLKQEGQLPQIIWLGNGEMIPVAIQLYLQQQPVGEVIQLNRLGLVVKEYDTETH